MKILAALFALTFALTAQSNAYACDRSGVPAYAIGADGKIQIDVLFKPGTDMAQALAWASKLGDAKPASRRVPALRIGVQCMETARLIASNPQVQASSFAPPPPDTFPGVTVR